MDAQLDKLNEFNRKYEELKEKFADVRECLKQLADEHMRNSELFYSVKKELHLLQAEMDSIRKLRDEIKS